MTKPVWQCDLLGLGTLLKYGSETVFGYSSRKAQALAKSVGKPTSELPSKLLARKETAQALQAAMVELYADLCEGLISSHKAFKKLDIKMEKDRVIMGSMLPEEQVARYDKSKQLYERLYSSASALAECIGMEVPLLEEEEEIQAGTNGDLAGLDGKDKAANLYGDAESRAFYEDIPDLLNTVPLAALGITAEQALALREEWRAKRENVLSMTGDDGSPAPIEEVVSSADDVSAAPEGDKEASKASFEDKLPECFNRQRADEFSISFCYHSNKNAKKKLIKALCYMPRGRSDLTATYSRILATISRVYPDIVDPVLDHLHREFFGLMKNKSTHVDSKIRNIKYTSELVKFGLAPPITAFRMIKLLLSDFTNQNVELLSVLLETCGRYLYLLPFTHMRIEEVLDTILRLKRAKHIDVRQQDLIDSAYFAVKPPEKQSAEAAKPLTNAQKWCEHLLLVQLDKACAGDPVEGVLKSLRRLPWSSVEEDIEGHLAGCCLRSARTKYVNIHLLADVISGLRSRRPNLATKVVDTILEEVQRGLDAPQRRETQRLIGVVRLLGELYNFKVVSSTLIFDFLYHVLNYGHYSNGPSGSSVTFFHVEKCQNDVVNSILESTFFATGAADASKRRFDTRQPTPLDSSLDLFRAQLVCEILNTCGIYYVKATAREKLCRFLLYFQRYLFTKRFVPMQVEFTILDTFDKLEDLARAAIKKESRSAPNAAVFTRYDSSEVLEAAIKEVEGSGSDIREDNDNDNDDDDDDDDNNDNDDDLDDIKKLSEQDADTGAQGDPGGCDESDDESDDSSNDGVSNDEAARLLNSMRIAEEDDEFEKMFKAAMQSSVEQARGNASKNSDLSHMSIPAVLPKPKNSISSFYNTADIDTGMTTIAEGEEDEDEDDTPLVGDSASTSGKMPAGFVVKLLSRDSKGRNETRELRVPESNSIAIKLQGVEEQNRVERQRIKDRVLQIEKLNSEVGGSIADESEEIQSADYFASREYRATPKAAVQGRGTRRGRNGAIVKREERRPIEGLNLDQFLKVPNPISTLAALSRPRFVYVHFPCTHPAAIVNFTTTLSDPSTLFNLPLPMLSL